MTDLRKAAEMALEALETLWDILDDIDTASDMAKENDAWYRKRVEALQKKRWDTMITTDGYKLKGGPVEALRQALAQPEQEPVGYAHVEDLKREHHDFYVNRERGVNEVPLYTAPPQKEEGCAECGKQASKGWALYCVECVEGKREWVGLTDEEIQAESHKLDLTAGWTYDHFAKAIEAKLKEKNT